MRNQRSESVKGTGWTTRTANHSMIQFDLLSSLDLPISKWRWCYAVPALFPLYFPFPNLPSYHHNPKPLLRLSFPLTFKQAAPSLFILPIHRPADMPINQSRIAGESVQRENGKKETKKKNIKTIMPQHSRTLRRLCVSRSLSHTHKGILCTCLNFYVFPVFSTYLFDFKRVCVWSNKGWSNARTFKKKKQTGQPACQFLFTFLTAEAHSLIQSISLESLVLPPLGLVLFFCCDFTSVILVLFTSVAYLMEERFQM